MPRSSAVSEERTPVGSMRHATSLRPLLPTALPAALALSILAGCKEAASPGDSLIGSSRLRTVVFVARTVEPSGYMEALFSGVITVDAAGCLRMEGLEAHTPIWPRGYRLEVTSGAGVVRSGNGSIVGIIGGHFRLGGGEVQTLEWVEVTPADRERVTSTCPGRYWIVSGP